MSDHAEKPFDPLQYANIARSVVAALLGRPIIPALELGPFRGAGIYAIYYGGPFDPYVPIASRYGELPIYVGKAVPAGSRKGYSDPGRPQKQPLFHANIGVP